MLRVLGVSNADVCMSTEAWVDVTDADERGGYGSRDGGDEQRYCVRRKGKMKIAKKKKKEQKKE